jgi:hypothetical protein
VYTQRVCGQHDAIVELARDGTVHLLIMVLTGLHASIRCRSDTDITRF